MDNPLGCLFIGHLFDLNVVDIDHSPKKDKAVQILATCKYCKFRKFHTFLNVNFGIAQNYVLTKDGWKNIRR